MSARALAVLSLVAGLTVSACSSSGSGSAPPPTSGSTTAPAAAGTSAGAATTAVSAAGSTAVAPVASGGVDACKVVTAALLKSTIGLDAGDPIAKPSNVGGSTCDYQAKTSITDGYAIVQTSAQPDLYFPDSLYGSAQGAVKVTAAGADRGWISAQPTGGTVLVVKGKVGVMVNFTVPGAHLTAADDQKLAAALAAAL
jgi:hypothetical protein